MVFTGLPPAAPGQRIGLYGGSFNPAHLGHRHVSLTALRRLALDKVWWLVTPGNPLKDRGALAPLAERAAEAARVAADPRIAVTTIEAALQLRYTRETLRHLRARRPDLRFVWIMGADSLATFHRWRGFREIAALMPIAVVDRPGFTLRALQGPGAQAMGRARIPERDSAALAGMRAPAWVFLHGPRSPLSSTELRQTGPSPRPRGCGDG
ncbi:nicotinate-nucleotide adenylyltransferase [Methylobacterium planeticum]|uniref:Probable nicotinate-nucleotide adenylyltransferase n=1 Tax=Methylobacterium planeticum TaxID=2615211 RepID=A0A6N6MZT1_9HYPH|nr:nicotinate-nucleotide adenylyltransferase [Methylobacterium planeticum]KAB1076144.1 nicotinate-nucleotide adenylyltransferase [Methylobacterium planeticum]